MRIGIKDGRHVGCNIAFTIDGQVPPARDITLQIPFGSIPTATVELVPELLDVEFETNEVYVTIGNRKYRLYNVDDSELDEASRTDLEQQTKGGA